jgi:prevent-host-death family protein
VRELRQNASAWLRRVEAGDSFEITNGGRPVALLVPLPRGSKLERMIAEGRVRPGRGNLADLPPPLPRDPDKPSPSEVLEQMRADESY